MSQGRLGIPESQGFKGVREDQGYHGPWTQEVKGFLEETRDISVPMETGDTRVRDSRESGETRDTMESGSQETQVRPGIPGIPGISWSRGVKRLR